MLIKEIKLLLDLFHDHVPDKESNRLVFKFCNEKHRWPNAKGLFGTIRDRNIAAERKLHTTKQYQYAFEEIVSKTLYNLTMPSAPFNLDSPYWVIKNALQLSQCLGIHEMEVVRIVAPNK